MKGECWENFIEGLARGGGFGHNLHVDFNVKFNFKQGHHCSQRLQPFAGAGKKPPMGQKFL